MGTKVISDYTTESLADNDMILYEKSSDGTYRKVLYSTFAQYVIGELKEFDTYIPISSTFPWFCLSQADQEMSTTNYSSDFIDYQRAKKLHYDEFDTDITSFSGTWSSNVFTLTDNDANNAMVEALASDYIFQGDFTNFRLLNDGTNDFEITDISASGLTITVDNTDNTPSGTSIEIYLNRVYGSTTACRHYSHAGIVNYQAGDGKIAGLRHLDQMQGWQLGAEADNTGARNYFGFTDLRDYATDASAATDYTRPLFGTFAQGYVTMLKAMNDGNNGDPRTGSETMARNVPIHKYIFVDSYTA